MATITIGIGTSHSPLLSLEPERWPERAADDLRNQRLNTSDGRWVSYDQLNAEVGGRYAGVATVEQFIAKSQASQAAIERLGDALEAARPDVVIIVGDDQSELFTPDNTPAVAVYYGEEIVMRPRDLGPGAPSWAATVAKGYAVDRPHRFTCASRFGRALAEGLMAQQVDVAVLSKIEEPAKAGFGHAFGFVINRLFRGRKIPVAPVLLNTYYPPNVPTPARCHDIGRALRRVVEAMPPARVAVVASGGLSHFVVDEPLDHLVIDALRSGQHEPLRKLPAAALNAGSSEIRNWIAMAGAIEGLTSRWLEYQPLQRTPAGTGIGVAFGLWS